MLRSEGQRSIPIRDSQIVFGAPILVITKDDGIDIVAPNAILNYTITISNNSLQDSTGLQLVDTIPNGTSFISATDNGTFSGVNGQVTWAPFDLMAGNSIQFTVHDTSK